MIRTWERETRATMEEDARIHILETTNVSYTILPQCSTYLAKNANFWNNKSLAMI